MRAWRAAALGALGVALLLACGSSSSGGGTFMSGDGGSSSGGSSGGASSGASSGSGSGGNGGTLEIQPNMVTLAASVGGGSSQQAVKVLEHSPMGGFPNDVTSTATLTLGDPMIATITGANIGGGKYGGNTTITATLQGDTPGMAMLKVQLSGDLTMGVGGKDQGNFASASPTSSPAPAIQSPAGGSMLTSSAPPLTVSYTGVGACNEYRVHLASTDLLDVNQYTTDATQVTFDATAWPNILKSMRGASATMTAECWTAPSGTTRYVSAPVTITVGH